MPSIAMSEMTKSRAWQTGDNRNVEYLYTLTGTSNDITARDYVEANSPTSVDGLPRKVVELTPDWTDSITDDGRWDVAVEYALLDLLDETTPRQAFDTTGGTQHITQSIDTRESVRVSGGVGPDNKGAIGVTDDGVDGVDIIVPVYKWTETHIFPIATVDSAYKGNLFALTARINGATFREFAIGEVLFLGVVGTQRSATEWELTFAFAASPNRDAIAIGDELTITHKGGHDYLWVRYTSAVDGTSQNSFSIKKPYAAYVERVYRVGNFSGLEIGVDPL